MTSKVNLKAEINSVVNFLTDDSLSFWITERLHQSVQDHLFWYMQRDEDNFRPHLSEIGDIALRRVVLRFYLGEIHKIISDEDDPWNNPPSELMQWFQLIDIDPIDRSLDGKSLGDILGAALEKSGDTKSSWDEVVKSENDD